MNEITKLINRLDSREIPDFDYDEEMLVPCQRCGADVGVACQRGCLGNSN